MRDPQTGEQRFARVKIPPILSRLVEVDPGRFVLIDQVIEANLDELFRGMEIVETHLFRVTRDADLAIEEDEADDLLLAIEEELRRRRFGEAVRLEVERSMPATTRAILLRGIGLRDEDCYEISGMLDHTGLGQLLDLDRPDLKVPPWTPVIPTRLIPPDEDEPIDMFEVIRTGDLLVHHPYESFSASTERFVAQAADDPDVLSIKQTLYRTSGDSPIVRSLIRAAESGKQVVVLVEIKARFDEEANIIWARRLEQAGAHVVYGLVGLKTHSKVCLIVRREGNGLRRYVHIGTGNYNAKTARMYVDLGLLSCREELGADVTDLFNVLTGLSRQSSFRRLLVAPITLRPRFVALVEREMAHATAGRPARIVIKTNAIVDIPSIDVLYAASEAGVEIECIVRSACCLLPGVAGMSDHIRVRSIVGEFLEHSRIWMFENGGDREWFIGSADLMDRNLDRRVEAVTPVEDHEARARLDRIVRVMLEDDRRSWQLRPDASWVRTEVSEGREGTCDTFAALKEDALAMTAPAVDPASRGSGGGLPGSARMTDGSRMEVELKYRVSRSGAADRFVTADEVAGFRPVGQVRSIQHEDRYVDTTDAAIARAGFGARLRQAGNGFLISMKSLASGSSGGATHRREELEGPADKGMAPGDWPPSAARSLVLELAGDAPLVEVVTVRQLRRKREYRRAGTLVEISLDEVDVVVRGDVVERFQELELEVMDGDDADLSELAEAIDGTDGLEPVGTSKLERALDAAHRVGNGKAALADVVLAHARAASPAPVRERAGRSRRGDLERRCRGASPGGRPAADAARHGSERGGARSAQGIEGGSPP